MSYFEVSTRTNLGCNELALHIFAKALEIKKENMAQEAEIASFKLERRRHSEVFEKAQAAGQRKKGCCK